MTSPNMKILVCCTTESWGGLEQTAFRDVLNLKAMGIEAALLCLDRGALYENARERGIEFYSVAPSDSYFNYGIFRKIKKICSKRKFNVVHIHSFNNIFSILLALKSIKIPVFATRHIYVEHVKKDLLHKWYLGRIDKMLAISNFSRKNILDTYPISDNKIETLYLGIDLVKYSRTQEKADAFRKQFSIPKTKSIIGVIGRIDPAKGQLEFINAIPEINKEFPETHFVIVGKPTSSNYQPYLVELKKKVNELGIAEFVTFTGFCSDISVPLSAMDVFVMPSYFEAFGLIAIEAMACKVPVVATNMGSIDEIIPNYDHGIKIQPKSAEQISDAVKILLADKELRTTISNNAYKFVTDNFDEKNYFNKLIQIYRTLFNDFSTK